MTQIKPESPLRRETGTYYRGRPLLIELHPGYAVLRRKGTRQRVAVSYDAILEFGYKILARQAALEKAERKKQKRAHGA
jgi:hypothetical protein